MKKNMSYADRIVRILVVIVVAILWYTDTISGTLAYVLMALSAIFLITSLLGWCGIYALLGIQTCKTKTT